MIVPALWRGRAIERSGEDVEVWLDGRKYFCKKDLQVVQESLKADEA